MKQPIELVIAPDDNVIAPSGVLLNSIARSNPGENIRINVLHVELSEENLNVLMAFGRSLGFAMCENKMQIAKPKHVRGNMRATWHTVSTLLRCYMVDYRGSPIERIIYLDTDTVVIQPLRPLFETKLAGKTAAGVVSVEPRSHLIEHHVEPEDYFNTGVMVIDLNRWRKLNIGSKLEAFMLEHPDKCIFLDQCALNVVLNKDCLKLDNRWNYITSSRKLNGFDSLAIIHYAGSRKPWFDPGLHPLGAIYVNYSQGTRWEIGYERKQRSKKSFATKALRSLRKHLPNSPFPR